MEEGRVRYVVRRWTLEGGAEATLETEGGCGGGGN